jgi:hypothetical protein
MPQWVTNRAGTLVTHRNFDTGPFRTLLVDADRRALPAKRRSVDVAVTLNRTGRAGKLIARGGDTRRRGFGRRFAEDAGLAYSPTGTYVFHLSSYNGGIS